jgi:hypothetical protein
MQFFIRLLILAIGITCNLTFWLNARIRTTGKKKKQRVATIVRNTFAPKFSKEITTMKQHILKLTFIFALGMLIAGGFFQNTAPVSAAPDGLVFNVNDTADLPDANPGDGTCLASNNKCTLRAAVMEANKHKATDIINLQANATYKLTRAGEDDTAENGDLDVRESINLNGNGATIDANGAVTQDRAFYFLTTKKQLALSQLKDLKITGGRTTASGGGIWNQGYLFLTNIVIASNHADTAGGGIANDGLVLARESTVENNNCTCASAQQPGGGGILNHNVLFLFDSTISNNLSHFDGGGIWSDGDQLILITSTVAQNLADRHGAGIYMAGGEGFSAHSTIAVNFADYNDDDVGYAGGIYADPSSKITLGHTLLAENGNVEAFLWKWEDCHGKLDGLGYNLIYNNNLCVVGAANSLIGVPAHLDSFDYHGGPTKTYSIESNSWAIDNGNPDECKFSAQTISLHDQRGHQRIADGNGDNSARCDIGAYEAQANPVPEDCSSKPTKPTLQSPDNKAEVTFRQVALLFDSDCADTYNVVVRQDAKKGPIVDKLKGLTMNAYFTAKLKKGHTYYWRVSACNAQGCTKSAWFTFTVKP